MYTLGVNKESSLEPSGPILAVEGTVRNVKNKSRPLWLGNKEFFCSRSPKSAINCVVLSFKLNWKHQINTKKGMTSFVLLKQPLELFSIALKYFSIIGMLEKCLKCCRKKLSITNVLLETCLKFRGSTIILLL